MTTFNNLTQGKNMRQTFYIASPGEAIEAIKTDSLSHEYYIVRSFMTDRLHIYLNIKSVPNGVGQYGKIYEGKSKLSAIAAIKQNTNLHPFTTL